MQITLNEQNQILLNEIVKELIVIKQELLELSIVVLIQLKNFIIQFIMSYKEYSLVNIREQGLGEILTIRALRFFKLETEEPREKEKKKRKSIKVKRSGAYYIKKATKTILFPFYLLILLLDSVLRKKEKASEKPKNKFVKSRSDE